MQIPSINPIPLSTRFSTNIYFTDGEDHLSSTHTYISQTNGFSILCAQIRNAHFLGALTLISIRPPYHLWGNANCIDSFIYNLYTNKRDFPWPAAASLCEGNIDGGDYRQKAQLRHRKGLIDCNKFSLVGWPRNEPNLLHFTIYRVRPTGKSWPMRIRLDWRTLLSIKVRPQMGSPGKIAAFYSQIRPQCNNVIPIVGFWCL